MPLQTHPPSLSSSPSRSRSPISSSDSSTPSLATSSTSAASSLASSFHDLSLAEKEPQSPPPPPYRSRQSYQPPVLTSPALLEASHQAEWVKNPPLGALLEDMHQNEPSKRDQARDVLFNGYSSHHPPPSAHSIQSDRPNLAHRTSSYSKRHASFDTPREVPLPFMQPRRPQQSSYPSSNSNSHGVPPVSTGTILPEGEYGSAAHMNSSGAVLDARGVPYGSRLDGPPCSSNIPPATPLTRPQMDSRRASSSSRRMDTREDTILPPTSSQRSGSGQQQRLIQRASSGAVPLFGRPFSSPMGPATNSTQTPDRICSPAPVRPATRNSTASLPSPMNTPYSTLQTHSGSTIHEGQEMRMDPETRPPSAASHRSRRRPLPQPPALPQHSSSPPPYSPAQPLRSAFLNADARSDITATSSTYSSYPRTADPFADRHHRDRDRSVTSSTASLASASGSGFAPPAPPTVLSPTPVDHGRDSRSAAHNSFLSQSSPTREVYIAVETLAREYKLVVRLPGYRRDSITLSTRKRRILHLVADSWEPEGGHFERRISFGYDAELSQIRAEFDGDFLKVIVPRRAAPVTYWGSSRD